MDQIKIGAFLKTLRKEKNLTQEQAAEQLGVSNRTVSRWETGTNMPDISLLVEISVYHHIAYTRSACRGCVSVYPVRLSDDRSVPVCIYGNRFSRLYQQRLCRGPARAS